MKKLLTTLLLIGLSAPVASYEQFRASDGTSCRSDRDTRSTLTMASYTSNKGETGVKASITIKLGSMGESLNCKRIENLEVERLKLELQLLRQQLNQQDTWE